MIPNASLPPVFFNHLYVVLDDKTYRAIQASDFLRSAFPGAEQRATRTAAGETWVGTYFYCQDNYLEFFGESASKHWQIGAQAGWAGLAFSTDEAGGAPAVREALRQAFSYEPFFELRQLTTGKTINWFYQVRIAELLGLGSFESWMMEYHPDIFAYKGIDTGPGGKLTRMAYLSAWNQRALQGQQTTPPTPPILIEQSGDESNPAETKPSTGQGPEGRSKSKLAKRDAPPGVPPTPPVFSRVIGATIHMDHKRAERYSEILTMLGYQREKSGPKGALTLSAHGFTLCIEPKESGPEGYRLSSLRMAMSRLSVAPMTFVFASGSRLDLREDLTAEWRFGV